MATIAEVKNKLDFSQLMFIKKEYNYLSGICETHYKSNNLDELQEVRDRLGVFIFTIEGLTNFSFYKDILPILK